MKQLYESLGISKEVYEYGEGILEALKERFAAIDETAEYNQLKVIAAMQKAHVSEIRSKRSMQRHFIRRQRLYVRRSRAVRMHWQLRWQATCVRAMSYCLFPAGRMIP